MVMTRFLGSVIIGHGSADDLVKHFHELCGRLDVSNILQIGMNGPLTLLIHGKIHQVFKKQNFLYKFIGDVIKDTTYDTHPIK